MALSVILPALNFWPASLPEKPVNAVQQYIPDFSFKSQASNNMDWKFVLTNLFYAGMVLMFARFVAQLFSVIRLGKKSEKQKLNDIVIVNTTKNISPFSFFNHIYVNSKQHTAADFEQILRHEIIHAKEGHSVDILMAEFYNIVFWFNPFAWLLKASLKQNLEFITDTKVLKSGVDAKLYQYCLLKVSGIHTNMAAASYFNFTKLKNRIIMMNKKRSSPVNILKYLLLLPLITFLLMSFNGTQNHQGKPALIHEVTDTLPEAPPVPPLPAEPPVPPVPPQDVIKYIPKNKANKGVQIVTDLETGKTVVTNKNGTKEEYNLSNAAEQKKFQSKYGELPPPPPPMPAPLPPSSLPTPPPPPPAKVLNAVEVDVPANAPLMLVDGKEIASIKEVDQKSIASVEVLTDADAVEKYGVKGKNGVVIISMKTTLALKDETLNDENINYTTGLANQQFDMKDDGGNRLYYLNGKEVKWKELPNIKKESIASIDLITSSEALKKYGEKGKNGVVIIKTK